MADSQLPTPRRGDASSAGPDVRHDAGGWISGSAVTAEPVPAGEIRPGDVIVLDDFSRAQITDVRHGVFWLDDGHNPGVALGWRSLAGNASGVLFCRADDMLARTPEGGSREYRH